jgi:uncharacterized membrane protein
MHISPYHGHILDVVSCIIVHNYLYNQITNYYQDAFTVSLIKQLALFPISVGVYIFLSSFFIKEKNPL